MATASAANPAVATIHALERDGDTGRGKAGTPYGASRVARCSPALDDSKHFDNTGNVETTTCDVAAATAVAVTSDAITSEATMKRFHVHVGVADLEANIRFYSGLFGSGPTVRKADYAKWMIDEPRLNFAISAAKGHTGVSHLGLEADSPGELAEIQRSFAAADPGVHDEPDAACCYARSDKHWATDPQGLRWEGFHSRGLLENEVEGSILQQAGSTCCAPRAAAEPAAGAPGRCCA
jgi:catechol 2,3-dioxygenase-like lactoylglutathione lyase family enzyme